MVLCRRMALIVVLSGKPQTFEKTVTPAPTMFMIFQYTFRSFEVCALGCPNICNIFKTPVLGGRTVVRMLRLL